MAGEIVGVLAGVLAGEMTGEMTGEIAESSGHSEESAVDECNRSEIHRRD
jgi:hypothetical protein